MVSPRVCKHFVEKTFCLSINFLFADKKHIYYFALKLDHIFLVSCHTHLQLSQESPLKLKARKIVCVLERKYKQE